MPSGTVKFFNVNRGFGFIQPEGGGDDVFVHITALEKAGVSALSEGQTVTYELDQDRRGRPRAVNLKI